MVLHRNYFDVTIHLRVLSGPTALQSHIQAEWAATYRGFIRGQSERGPSSSLLSLPPNHISHFQVKISTVLS